MQLYAVACRFHFSDRELAAMKLSRLAFWYQGHEIIHREEVGATDGK